MSNIVFDIAGCVHFLYFFLTRFMLFPFFLEKPNFRPGWGGGTGCKLFFLISCFLRVLCYFQKNDFFFFRNIE